MKGKMLGISLLVFVSNSCFAEPLDLATALQNTYRACVNIDDNLHELKVLAGVNTGVTAVGTGLGIGAVATGLAKKNIDEEIEDLFAKMRRLSNEYQGDDPTKEQKDDWYKKAVARIDAIDWDDPQIEANEKKNLQAIQDLENQIEEKEKKSKNLGNWRTGLLAGNTATNVAGAIIASKTINKDDINGQIEACISATKDLNNAINAARMNGEDTTEAKSIYSACREYAYVDISPINKRGTGSMIASSVGAVVGGVGTITSGVANSDSIREDDTESGKQKEKSLNTASNLLSFGATAASATATVFNATQIAAIKKVATVAQKCTEVLK